MSAHDQGIVAVTGRAHWQRQVAFFLDSDDSDTDIPQHKFLAASLEYQPGYFACDIKWQTQFILHPRLKTGSGRSGLSRGMC